MTRVSRLVRSMFVAAILGNAVLGGTFMLAAQDYTITRSVFLPSVYYVGDRVELRLSLRTALSDRMQVPQELAQPAWGTIHSVSIVQQQDEEEPEVRIVFTSYAAGTRALPALNLGAIVLEGIEVYVSSLISEGRRELASLRDQANLPQTAMQVLFQVLLALAIPALLVLLFIRGKPLIARLISRYRAAMPYRRFQKAFKAITNQVDQSDARSFYIQTLNETRMYLSDRLSIPAISATSAELEALLTHHVDSPDVVIAISALFYHGDRVKFAGLSASVPERLQDLYSLEQAVRKLEHLVLHPTRSGALAKSKQEDSSGETEPGSNPSSVHTKKTKEDADADL